MRESPRLGSASEQPQDERDLGHNPGGEDKGDERGKTIGRWGPDHKHQPKAQQALDKALKPASQPRQKGHRSIHPSWTTLVSGRLRKPLKTTYREASLRRRKRSSRPQSPRHCPLEATPTHALHNYQTFPPLTHMSPLRPQQGLSSHRPRLF